MRKLREVVGKEAEKTRQTKSESYDLTDAYEVGLLNYAEDPKHGNYSEFIKRAIAYYRDREGGAPVYSAPVAPAVIEQGEDDELMGGYL